MIPKLMTYTRGLIPLTQIFFATKAVNQLAGSLNDMDLSVVVYAHKNNKLWWSWSEEEITALGHLIWQKTSTKENADNHFQTIKRFHDQACIAAEEVRLKNLQNLNVQELVNLHTYLYDQCKEAHALMNPDIDAVDIVPVQLLKELLQQELSSFSEPEFIEIYTKLTTPIHVSYVAEQEKEFLQLLLQIKENKIEIPQLQQSKLYSQFQALIQKYWWTSLGFENRNLKTEEEYLQDLQEYDKDIAHLPTRIQELENYKERVRQQREQLIQEYNLNPEAQHRLQVFDTYTFFHDLRKEMQMRTMYAFQLLYEEMGGKINLSMDLLQYYTDEEVISFCTGKKTWNTQEQQQREAAQFLFSDKQGYQLYSGSEALQKIHEFYEATIEHSNELQGVCSSPGKVQGIVKICNGAADALAKIKKGDVLVTGMTLPDYVPAMRKAAAIVTDEGGITCHAAIVSRELGKPCITGTKIATQVLKDNMFVEVDANTGIVRKL